MKCFHIECVSWNLNCTDAYRNVQAKLPSSIHLFIFWRISSLWAYLQLKYFWAQLLWWTRRWKNCSAMERWSELLLERSLIRFFISLRKKPHGKCQTLIPDLIFRRSHEIVMHRSVITVMGGCEMRVCERDYSDYCCFFLVAVKTFPECISWLELVEYGCHEE